MEWIPEFLILPAATERLPTLCLRKKRLGGWVGGKPVREQGMQPWPAQAGVCADGPAVPSLLLRAVLRGQSGDED